MLFKIYSYVYCTGTVNRSRVRSDINIDINQSKVAKFLKWPKKNPKWNSQSSYINVITIFISISFYCTNFYIKRVDNLIYLYIFATNVGFYTDILILIDVEINKSWILTV